MSGIERVVAIADVHVAYAELVGLLKSVGLVDEQLRWSACATHLADQSSLGVASRLMFQKRTGIAVARPTLPRLLDRVIGSFERG